MIIDDLNYVSVYTRRRTDKKFVKNIFLVPPKGQRIFRSLNFPKRLQGKRIRLKVEVVDE